ncbi:MAG: hypothetical protein IKG03_07915 [Clostridiales bacterium]|nr:hypothetical protein [Clostridiales bacterium]
MSRNSVSLTETSPLRYLFLLIPFAIATVLGICTMGAGDTSMCLWWAVFLLLTGFVTLPLAARIWEKFSSGGFFLSQPLGLVLTCLVLWTLTHLKICRLNILCIVISALIVAACCYIPKSNRDCLVKKMCSKGFVEAIAVEETVFLVIFFLMCFFKGFLPDINGQEKFMDYGFIMSMQRGDSLPANDMWLSGYSINYYYFGQFIWSVVIKATCVPTGVGYNLAMCSATAIPFAMSFSIGKYLIEAASARGFKENRIIKYVAGFFTGCAVSLWGNSHSYFYDEESIGNKFLDIFKSWGIDVGRTDNFFYPDSTRYIGWNPDLKTDYTIEEFPFYSFLVGDLHAHVISMIIVLLIMAVILSLICLVKLPSGEEIDVFHSLDNLSGETNRILPELESTVTLHLVLCAVLLGCAQMTNYWDFLIYFVFCSMGVLIVNTIRSPKFVNIPGAIVFVINVGGILLIYLAKGDNPPMLFALELILMIASFLFCVVSPTALPRTSFQMSFLFTVATLTALPFNINFDMISNSLGAVKNRSSFYQLFILYGTHVIISVFFMVLVFATKNYRYTSISKAKKKAGTASGKAELFDGQYAYNNPVQAFFAKRNLIDIFCCGMTIVGLMLLTAPEIFYVRDIYTGGYLRSNTMFKFAFAALIILSVTMIYSVIRLFWFVNRKGQYSLLLFAIAIGFAICLFVPAHYTMASLKQRCGVLKRENYRTLDGTAYVETYTSPYINDQYSGNLKPYLACAEWFNENVKGSPVICEAYGDSYTDNCFISAYTGLPTVFGWQTHEWLWRFHGIVNKETDTLESDPDRDVWKLYITPRHADVDTIYWNDYPSEVQSVIDKYQIEYIIMGDLERYKYGRDNSGVFSELGPVVFQYEDLRVYKVTPS